jgi:hypothetical protein
MVLRQETQLAVYRGKLASLNTSKKRIQVQSIKPQNMRLKRLILWHSNPAVHQKMSMKHEL